MNLSDYPPGLTFESIRAQAHEQKVRNARDSLLDYGRLVVPDFETPRHIKLLAAKLEAV